MKNNWGVKLPPPPPPPTPRLGLKNYNKIWQKAEKLLKTDFERKPVYDDDDKYIKTKIKIYAGSIIINFHNKKRKSTM